MAFDQIICKAVSEEGGAHEISISNHQRGVVCSIACSTPTTTNMLFTCSNFELESLPVLLPGVLNVGVEYSAVL